MSEEQPPAAIQVVAGHPTAEELAAVVTVLAARRAADDATAPTEPERSPWSAYWRRIRETPRPGPGAWRASGLPR